MKNLHDNDVEGPLCDSTLFDNVITNEKLDKIFSFIVSYYINYNIQNMVGELKAPLRISVSISQLTIEDDESHDTI